jgi:hypothetical protein
LSKILTVLFLTLVLIAVPSFLSSHDAPSVDLPSEVYKWENSCYAQVDFQVHGMAPNVPIIAVVSRDTAQCDGSGRARLSDIYHLGITDSYGSFTWSVVLTDWGNTQYTFFDETGTVATTKFHFEKGKFSEWSTEGIHDVFHNDMSS